MNESRGTFITFAEIGREKHAIWYLWLRGWTPIWVYY